MKKLSVVICHLPFCGLTLAVLLSGCVVRTYSATKDRVDQDISGNQGYISGSAPSGAQQPKKFNQRTTKVVEIELRSPVRFERLKVPPKPIEEREDASLEGNRGYVGGEILKPEQPTLQQPEAMLPETPTAQFDTYVVQRDDTLQKISAQFYGTTKKWMKIFEANKEKLKSPDRIRPGQEIKIPRE